MKRPASGAFAERAGRVGERQEVARDQPAGERNTQHGEHGEPDPRPRRCERLARTPVDHHPYRRGDHQQADGEARVHADACKCTSQRPPRNRASLDRAPKEPRQPGPEWGLGDVVLQLRGPPGVVGDAREQQRARGRALGSHQIAAQQEDEDEGRSDEELRDDIGRPSVRTGEQIACLERPARHGRMLVGGDHPLPAPHVALDHVQGRGDVGDRRRQRPGHHLTENEKRDQDSGLEQAIVARVMGASWFCAGSV